MSGRGATADGEAQRAASSGRGLGLVHVVVNGTERSFAGGSVRDLLVHLSLPVDRVAVERNLMVVPRAAHGATRVENGDRYEIVAFVGGG